MPTWEEYWGKGGINDREEAARAAEKAKANTYVPPPTYNNSNSSTNYTSTSSGSGIMQPAAQQTNQSGQVQLPSWMGNMYSQVAGTNYYSTNPSNPNAAKYYADGRPVPSISWDHTQTGGTKFDGYGSPEQFQQIMNSHNSGASSTTQGSQAMADMMESWLKNGQLTSNDSIYSNYGGSSGGSANHNSGVVGGSTQAGGGVLVPNGVPAPARWNVDAPYQERLDRFKTNKSDAQSELMAVKNMYVNEMKQGATAERLSQIHNWANQVRAAANISDQDVIYGNGPVTMGNGAGLGNGNTGGNGQGGGGGQGGFFGGGGQGGVKGPVFPVRDRAAISKYVDEQIAKKLSDAALAKSQAEREAIANADKSKGTINSQLTNAVSKLTNAAQQAQTGIQTGYERNKVLLNDNRVIEDGRNNRALDPFSGRSDYARGLIGREREITDRQASQDLEGRIGNLNQDLQTNLSAAQLDAQTRLGGIETDLNTLQQKLTENYAQLQNTSGAERERLLREIENDERDYALALRGEDRQDILADATLARDKFNQELSIFNANRGVYESDREYNLNVKDSDRQFDYNDKVFDLDKWYKEQTVDINRIEANKPRSSGGSTDSVGWANNALAREKWEWERDHPAEPKSEFDNVFNALTKQFGLFDDEGQPVEMDANKKYYLRQAIMKAGLKNTQDTMKLLAFFGLPLSDPQSQYPNGTVEMN